MWQSDINWHSKAHFLLYIIPVYLQSQTILTFTHIAAEQTV